MRVLGGEQILPRTLVRLMRDEVHRGRHACDARPTVRGRVVEQLRVDGRDEPRDRRAHAPLGAQPHVRHLVVEEALEERDGHAVVERQLMARGGGAQLLVIADQEQLLRGRIDRGEHVRLEHLGGLLHHKHTAAELAHEGLVLRRAGGGQTDDGRPLEHRECVELIELAHGCRDPAVLG